MAAVSIIMPVRNAERFLDEAIASVLRQTFPDWELLLVDDGSSDNSPAIAARAASADPRIRVLTSGHQGPAAARNQGIGAASGEYVAFLDADDLYEEGKLAFETDILARHPSAVMTYGPTYWWFEDEPGRSWTESMGRLAGKLHPPPELLSRVILGQQSQVPCTCAVLIRREVVVEAGGFTDGFSLYEDQSLWAKLMLRHPVYVHGRVLCRYRQHPQSISAHAEATGAYDRFRPHLARTAFLEWLDGHVRASGQSTPHLQRELRLAFAAYPGGGRSLTAMDWLVLAKRKLRRRAAWFWRRVARRLRLGPPGRKSIQTGA